MTRDPRPTAPPVPGKGGTRGLDTTDTSPGARHPTTLDDYPVPTKPDRHLTRYGSPVGWPVVGTGLRQGGVSLSATHRQTPRPQGPRLRWRLPYPRSRAGISRDTVPPWASLS